MKIKYILLQICFVLLLLITGCKKFVDIDPPATSLVSTSVFTTNASASAAITGIYSSLSESELLNYGNRILSLRLGLLSDELKNYSVDAGLMQYYSNAMSGTDSNIGWQDLYNKIYHTNASIEGLEASTGVSENLKKQLLGEAKFLRAFFFFYLVNMYGDIPMPLSTDYKVNNTLSRTPQQDVYEQIIKDLQDAQGLLSDNFLTTTGAVTTERVRPNKASATAMLARIYLYKSEWANAEAQATAVISNSSQYDTLSVASTFLKNTKESIWQLQPVLPGYNTNEARMYVLTSAPGSSILPVAISTDLQNAFEAGDKRFTSWVGKLVIGATTYYYPNKYKVYLQGVPVNGTYPAMTEYVSVLRIAEQYLIRAEARARQNNIAGAQADLNVIRKRAGLANTLAGDQPSLLTAILKERQVELFTEWGHRWLDLKRTGTINAVMSVVTPQKGGTWSPNWAVQPIPNSEILYNPNLTQNPGYF